MIDKTEDEKKRGALSSAISTGPIAWRRSPTASRLEFGGTRMDDEKSNMRVNGRRYPVCCLVLQPLAAIKINRMQQVSAALTKAGVVKATPSGSSLANGESEGGQSVQSPLKST
jgi:hypothetical protein